MNGPVLVVHELNVWFELPAGGYVHAVRSATFDVSRNECLGLVGESGCGKTTLALAMMGLLPGTASVSGSILFNGLNLLERGEQSYRRHRWVDIAMVFQGAMNGMNPVRTIGSQIREVVELHGVASGSEARAHVSAQLDRVGLRAETADRYPHELSGGMRQRAMVAMALSCRPQVLLADEPTTALDVMVQAQILALLVSLAKEDDLTVVFISHDLPVVAQVCQRAAVMYAGRVVELGRVSDLYHSPRHPYTKALFTATPDLNGRARVASLPGAPPRLDQEIIGCPFAPRCPEVFGACTERTPSLVEVDDGRMAACLLNTSDFSRRGQG